MGFQQSQSTLTCCKKGLHASVDGIRGPLAVPAAKLAAVYTFETFLDCRTVAGGMLSWLVVWTMQHVLPHARRRVVPVGITI